MHDVKHRLLQAINAHNGEWTWYQLDRVIVPGERAEGFHLVQMLDSLVADGLIQESTGPNPSQPVYSITDAGVSAIKAARFSK